MRNPFLTIFGLLVLLLASCGADRPLRQEPGGPALWRIEKDGRRAYVFGTIHVLPDGVAWETARLRKAMAQSDRLVIEALGTDDTASQKIFTEMGRSPGLPPIEARVPEEQRPVLRDLIRRGDMSEKALSGYESWAAALLLATVPQQDLKLSGRKGVEPALTQSFRDAGKPVEGLETIEEQFAIFDTQPEALQRRFLVQTVAQAAGARQQFEAMLKAWLSGDMVAIERDFISELAPEPELVGPLLTDRNKAWADEVAAMRGTPFVAVGAAHLAGPDNLLALLKAKGYRVKRVQ